MAKVAVENELETYVAANRRFRADRLARSRGVGQDGSAKVVPVFCNTTYQRESWLAGLRHLKRSKVVLDRNTSDERGASLPVRACLWLKNQKSKKRRRQVIAQFARDLGRYFESLPNKELNQEDHVFFTTVSELELMGLAIFLANAPWTQPATWHLQFHYNLFDGRTPEFEFQTSVLGKVRGCFLAALSRIPDHDLHFYCTAQELVEQFEKLKVARFTQLPYPINSSFAPVKNLKAKVNTSCVVGFSDVDFNCPSESDGFEVDSSENNSRLRMICPGELRREKGIANHLQSVINRLWRDYFACGKLEVAVQRPKKKPLRSQKVEIQFPDELDSNFDPVQYVQHPLSEEKYIEFIKDADFGLLMYDSRAYFSRRAGVLGELLACGKPVIVPAGCWLAHQLQEIQFVHIETLKDSMPKSRQLDLSALDFDLKNAPLSGGLVSFDQHRHPFEFKVGLEQEETLAIVSFDWHDPTDEGVDVSVEYVGTDVYGNRTSAAKQIVGHRRRGGQCHAIFRIDQNSLQASFSLSNAFHGTMATVKNLSVEFFKVDDPNSVPLGSVGLITPDNEQADVMVAEMVLHFEHYRDSAEKYSHVWYDRHDPVRTLEQLIGYSVDVSRRAA